MASLAKPPEAIPDAYANEVTKLHTSVATLFARKQIPYSVQAALAQEGYVMSPLKISQIAGTTRQQPGPTGPGP